ncbi:MAG TPA: BON domain-containing protein [Nevskiaceae bacterium]|nr:BON domain-containing protein [Nevskiaceae bacterium]
MKIKRKMIVLPLMCAAMFQTGHLLAKPARDDAPPRLHVADAELTVHIWDALAQDASLDTHMLEVRAAQGRVQLGGRMLTRTQAARVEDITARVAGVRDVTSLMRVPV